MNQLIEIALNDQIEKELSSSQYYLAMASWAEGAGLNGTAKFLYKQSEEERFHMLKLIKFLNERNGRAIIPATAQPPFEFDSIQHVFEMMLQQELQVSASINELADLTLREKDYATNNFLQWYVTEQLEEEAQARHILDKLKLVGGDRGALYMFDRDMETAVQVITKPDSVK